MEQQFELKVQDTNQEALASKISAIKKHYFQDPFAQELVKFKGRRDVIMHRGYWARVYMVKQLLDAFLTKSQQKQVQIISLGCGLDTLYFNLKNSQTKKPNYTYLEIDLDSVIKKKIKKIQNSQKIMSLLKTIQNLDIAENRTYIQSTEYNLLPCDLSVLQNFKKTLEKAKIDLKKPTLIFCQCVISYIDAHKFDEILKYIAHNFSLSFFLDYEMYNPNDRFGQMMVKNFANRGCPLIGIQTYPLIDDQKHRFLNLGFHSVEIYTMLKIYNEFLNKQEKQRIEKLQLQDEFEEWNIMMGHYFGLLAIGHTQSIQNIKSNQCFMKLIKNVKLGL